jgi:putative phosphoribosyl transferase
MRFQNRNDAGKQMAVSLKKYQSQDVIIYGLPRGGVVCAAQIANILKVPLDIIVTRKLGHPMSPEYAIGAVAKDGHTILNQNETIQIDKNVLKKIIDIESTEVKRRRETYLQNRHPHIVQNKTAIIVDDGLATGLTMRLAIEELKHQVPNKIVVAVPVASTDTANEIRGLVDELVVIEEPTAFLGSIGAYYHNFNQVDDETVIRHLNSPL